MNFQRMIALFMDYCMSKQLRPKTMQNCEQALQLSVRCLREEMAIENVEDVKEPHIRSYIVDLQKLGDKDVLRRLKGMDRAYYSEKTARELRH